ncbi:MAG: 1,4-alpha-glucan branching protein GlgB [Bacillota bacterium]|nr:1,4-alpha-glucan branching protein GlgB [Bacillota bacterium]
MLDERLIYLFNQGTNYQSYRFLGSLPIRPGDPESGYRFAVWAPRAKQVWLVGDFNDWQTDSHPMQRTKTGGIWYIEMPTARLWQRYKYAVQGRDGMTVLKCDPYARHQETRPGTASILYDPDDYEWQDDDWLAGRQSADTPAPLNIYEVHLGSWRRYPDGNVMNYRELARQLGDYCVDMGYNCVELLPVTEYPFDTSWGYQVTGYFAPTSRYGTPADFKFFVDHLHQLGIRVLLDWVPAHFPRDEFGLARFDGEPLYEHPDPRLGAHEEWGTLVFNYGRAEIESFLISSAWFWISEFHLDGLRVDAVSSILYTDYGRSDFVRNRYGGTTYLEAMDFLKHLNSVLLGSFPTIFLVAEESTSFPNVTKTTEEGGLGFTHKWNMGWMHDTLDYMDFDYYLRQHHHNQLTFSMTYAFSERFVLPFSHDEVVHGKRSLLDRMPGDLWRKFASFRTMLMYQIAHPGAKLNFMGYELGTFIEWRYYEELEWFLLEYPRHRQTQHFVRDLNRLYLSEPCFWQRDSGWDGFEWLEADDAERSVFAFARHGENGEHVVCLFNMTPAPQVDYELELPRIGRYKVLLSSDDHAYDGSGYLKPESRGMILEARPAAAVRSTAGLPRSSESIFAKPVKAAVDPEGKELPQRGLLCFNLPPLAGLFLRFEGLE